MEIPTDLAHRRQGSAFPPGWIGCHSWRNHIQGDLKEISRNCSFKKENPEYLKSTKMIVDLKISCQDHFITTWNLFSSLKSQNSHHHFPQVPQAAEVQEVQVQVLDFSELQEVPVATLVNSTIFPRHFHGILSLSFPTRQLLMVKLSTSWPLLQQSAWVYQTSEVKEAAWISSKFVKICVNLKWIYNIGYVAHIVGINGK